PAPLPPRRLQLTLALLKPDAVAHPLVREAVHAAILRHRFLIVRAKELRCGPEQSRRFYREHTPSEVPTASRTPGTRPMAQVGRAFLGAEEAGMMVLCLPLV
uniref:NME/NM23 nucleoside diphosphate kinase 6 n=1 Tax=Catharus ustulatus TaxID=91951 RepID=A0A8C3UFL4_CATUS